ncbi:MAG: hypothetical protein ABF739_00480 [Acetobacter okinawensis]|uniref:hypothetical protein n=1 Tax=Acetobacter okinawensis TaxID=1076594 RepID=UPI0039E79C50
MRIFQSLHASWAHCMKNRLCMGTVLASGPLLLCLGTPAMAAGDDASLDALEQQISRIQSEQRALQKALVSVQKQIAAHRTVAHAGTAAAHHGLAAHQLANIDAADNEAGIAVASTGHEDEPTPHHLGANGHFHASGPDAQPVFGGAEDTPTVESVVGHRAEDVISRVAENGVGPHSRETAGAQAAGALGDHGVFHLGPVTLILGGFIDASAVESNRHTASGTFNFWQATPFKNEPRYHTDNFDGSARYSRLSLMARGNVDKYSTISGVFEMDFGAGAATTDAYESNSYAFRMRQAYLAYDNSKENFHFLAGQAWSMLTPGRVGIIPRQESLPETIESSMLVGQTWARQLQFRFVKDFLNHRLWTGLSIENSATLYSTNGFGGDANGMCGSTKLGDGQACVPGGQVATIGSAGTGLTNNALFPNEIAPDVIGKIAWDPHWGHYEVEGILHFPHDRVSTLGAGKNHTAVGGGGGGSMILPVVPHKVEVRLAGLAGYGIGRYGSVLLPDATLKSNGAPSPLFSMQGTAGIIAHPNPLIDVYGYFGYQQAGRSYFSEGGTPYGYGNPGYNSAGCYTELGSCDAGSNIHSVMEATVGAWYRFLKGRYGTVEGGVQLAYSRIHAWEGNGGAPDTSLSEVFMDFRYLPFQ